MPNQIVCFLMEPTGTADRQLRRYSNAAGCTVTGRDYHNAKVSIGEFPLLLDEKGYIIPVPQDELPDPSEWPSTCACGYVFTEADPRQANQEQLYSSKDRGGVWTTDTGSCGAPPGAMWLATWYPKGMGSVFHAERGDGPHLMLRTPGGDWDVDATANNGPGWQRTGVPPKVTATPSIQCNAYHGWLRDGVLVEC